MKNVNNITTRKTFGSINNITEKILTEKVLKNVLFAILFFVIGLNLIETLFYCRAFFLDEWFIIDNIKFRSFKEISGELKHMQQFPRLILALYKQIGEWFDFSYTSLRFPSFLFQSIAILSWVWFCRKKLNFEFVLFVIVILCYIQYKTVPRNYVQIKQYSMEMLIGVIAYFQLSYIENYAQFFKNKTKIILLLSSFLFFPFCSYTYGIVVIPIALYILFLLIFVKQTKYNSIGLIFILISLIVGLTISFIFELQFVLKDKGMQSYWSNNLAHYNTFSEFLQNILLIFKTISNLVSGDFFRIFILFFIIGGIFIFIKMFFNSSKRIDFIQYNYLYIYALTVLISGIFLFSLGKLPFNVDRLNSFLAPALILLLVNGIKFLKNYNRIYNLLLVFILIHLIFNTFSLYLEPFKKKDLHNLSIQLNLENTIRKSENDKLPIFVTPTISEFITDKKDIIGLLKILPNYQRNKQYNIIGVDNEAEAKVIMKQKEYATGFFIVEDSTKLIDLTN